MFRQMSPFNEPLESRRKRALDQKAPFLSDLEVLPEIPSEEEAQRRWPQALKAARKAAIDAVVYAGTDDYPFVKGGVYVRATYGLALFVPFGLRCHYADLTEDGHGIWYSVAAPVESSSEHLRVQHAVMNIVLTAYGFDVVDTTKLD
jgi:hypothetical protein